MEPLVGRLIQTDDHHIDAMPSAAPLHVAAKHCWAVNGPPAVARVPLLLPCSCHMLEALLEPGALCHRRTPMAPPTIGLSPAVNPHAGATITQSSLSCLIDLIVWEGENLNPMGLDFDLFSLNKLMFYANSTMKLLVGMGFLKAELC